MMTSEDKYSSYSITLFQLLQGNRERILQKYRNYLAKRGKKEYNKGDKFDGDVV
jgi:hypothetical protein